MGFNSAFKGLKSGREEGEEEDKNTVYVN